MALSRLPALVSTGGAPAVGAAPFYAVVYFVAGLGLFGITIAQDLGGADGVEFVENG